MSNFLLNEAIHYASKESQIVISYIDGDYIKRVIKDVDFYYEGKKYFTTIEVINNSGIKELNFHEYEDCGIIRTTYKSFNEIIESDSDEILILTNLLSDLSSFSHKEMHTIELIRKSIIKKGL